MAATKVIAAERAPAGRAILAALLSALLLLLGRALVLAEVRRALLPPGRTLALTATG
jgi:hypothetical protein